MRSGGGRRRPGPCHEDLYPLSFVGTLQDLPLPDLLQALASGRKSGRLTLSSRDAYGVLLLRNGLIVYAASNAARETLGNLLVSRGLLGEAALQEALEIQHHVDETRRLGQILLSRRLVSSDDLADVLRQQVEGVLSELMRWPEGFFRFDSQEVPRTAGEPQVDVGDFLLQEGVPAEGMMLEAARLLDEARRRGRPPATATARQLAALKAVLAGLRAPAVTNEVSQQLLGFARGVVGRAVLFAARSDGFRALGQTGLALGKDAAQAIRALLLPWDDTSVLSHVAARQESFRGRLPKTPGNEALVAGLGGGQPGDAVALPLVVGSHTALVLYGDDLPNHRPLGEVDGLELLALQIGLALEKNLLELKLRALEEKSAGG